VKSKCLPLLTYCLGALVLTQSKVRDLGVCWNDCFRKIFKYNRWESVSELQQCCGKPSFERIYDKSRMNFRNSANALKTVWLVQQFRRVNTPIDPKNCNVLFYGGFMLGWV